MNGDSFQSLDEALEVLSNELLKIIPQNTVLKIKEKLIYCGDLGSLPSSEKSPEIFTRALVLATSGKKFKGLAIKGANGRWVSFYGANREDKKWIAENAKEIILRAKQLKTQRDEEEKKEIELIKEALKEIPKEKT